MASNKEYLEYILGQLSELEEITYQNEPPKPHI